MKEKIKSSKLKKSVEPLGHEITESAFSHPELQKFILSFDRVHHDHVKNTWSITHNILIDEPVLSFDGLSPTVQTKIVQLFDFAKFFSRKTQQIAQKHDLHNLLQKEPPISLNINLYLPKEHNQSHQAIQVIKNIVNKNDSENQILDNTFILKQTSLASIAKAYSDVNLNASLALIQNPDSLTSSTTLETLTQKIIPNTKDTLTVNNHNKLTSEQINNNRTDNSSDALVKALIGEQQDNGFHIDTTLFNPKARRVYFFKYLTDNVSQENKVSICPNMATNAFKFSQKLASDLIFIKYAPLGSPNEDNVNFMFVKSVQTEDKKQEQDFIVTKDTALTRKQLKDVINTMYLPLVKYATDKSTLQTKLDTQDINSNKATKKAIEPSKNKKNTTTATNALKPSNGTEKKKSAQDNNPQLKLF